MCQSFVFRSAGRIRLFTLAILAMAASACTATTSSESSLTMAGATTPPMGAIEFCLARPELCEASADREGSSLEGMTQASVIGSAVKIPLGGRGLVLKSVDLPSDVQQDLRLEETQDAAAAEPEPTAPPEPAADAEPSAELDQSEAAAPRVGENTALLTVDDDLQDLIERVNREVNRAMVWRSDRDLYALDEYWAIPLTAGMGREGDCEDFALEKRLALIEAGLPAHALALAQVYSPRTGMHAVLLVRTRSGDLVLDNETPWILPWNETGYRWLSVQSGPSLLDWSRVAA